MFNFLNSIWPEKPSISYLKQNVFEATFAITEEKNLSIADLHGKIENCGQQY